MKKLRWVLYSFLVAALLLWPVSALAQPPLPHAFYGTVEINTIDAPVNTVITAKVDGVICGNYTTKVVGAYGSLSQHDYLLVQGDISSGVPITFHVNGFDTRQTYLFKAGGGPTELNLTVTPPTIAYSPSSLSFTATKGESGPPSQTLSISNSGVDPTAMDWSVADDATWLSLSPASGSSSGEVDRVTVSVSISGMSAGSYSDTITISASAAINTPQMVPVTLTISAPGEAPPGPPPTYVETTLFGVEEGFRISDEGEILKKIEATSEDGNLIITIPRGTIALDKYGNPLYTLRADVDPSPPDPPEDVHIIGLAYDFGPDGATFDPAITLTWNYDPDALPEGAVEEDLVLAYYDEDIGEWVELPCEVDRPLLTASVSHFTIFAIIAPAPPVIVPPAPAAFTVSSLSIQPLEVLAREVVTISVAVANTGGTEGSYSVVLMVNGEKLSS